MATILCVVNDGLTPQVVSAQLAQEETGYRVALAITVLEAIAQVTAIAAPAADVPLVIAHQTLIDPIWIQSLYSQFPQALLLLLRESEDIGAIEALVPPGQLCGCLPPGWQAVDLRLALAEALRRCRQGQQLAEMQTALAATHRPMAQLNPSLDPGITPAAIAADAGRPELEPLIQATQARLRQIQRGAIAAPGGYTPLLEASLQEASCALEELQVAIEELHQQNTALLTAQQTLETERQRYQNLFNFAPDAYLVTDGAGIIQAINGVAEALLNVHRAGAVGKPLTVFVAAPDRPWIYRQLNRLAASPQPPHPPTQGTSWFSTEGLLLSDQELSIVPRGQEALTVVVSVSRECDRQGQVLSLYWLLHDVRAYEQVDQDLRRNRELREAIFNESTDGLFLVDAATNLIFDCNHRAVELFEAETKAGLIGKASHQLQCHPFTDGELAEIQQTITQKGFWSAEVEYLSCKGQRFWGNLAAKPIDVVDMALVLVRVTDITERRQIEAQIRYSEQQLQRTLAFTGVGAWRWYPATGAYEWNGLMEELLEIPLGLDNMFQLWCDRIHPDDIDRVKAAVETSLVTGLPFSEQYRYSLLDGQLCWRWLKGQGVYTAAGDLEHVLGVVQDITAQKQTEAALQASEQHRQLALELTHTGSWEFDAASGEVLWSDSHYRLVGLAPNGARVTYDTWREAVHPDDRESTEAAFAYALAHRTPLDMEYRLVLPDGSERWVLTRGHGLYDDHGQPLKMLGVMMDIDDRKRAEQALIQLNSELEQRVKQRTQELQKLAAIVENSIDFIGTASLSGDAFYINQAGRRLLGLPLDASIDRPIPSFHSPDTVARLVQDVLPVAINQGYWRGESTLRHQQTGEDIVVEQVIFLIRDADTQAPLCMATTCRDIRDRKQAELNLQESEARFRQITETIQEICWMTTADSSQVLYINPAFERVWGISCDALYQSIGLLAEAIHPDDLPGVRAALHPDRIRNYDQVYRIRRADGEIRWIHDRAFPVLDNQGEIYRIVGVANDITDRKQAEQALQDSRAMLQLVLDTIPQRVFWKDRNSCFIGCNLAFAKDFHISPAEVLGKTDGELPWAAWADQYRAADAEVIATQTPKLAYEELTTSLRGEAIWSRTSRVPLTRADGELIGVLGCYEDITAYKQAEAALQQLNTELEQRVQERTQALQQAMETAQSASRAKSMFLANMSHELRTPLNAILGFAQLMARDFAPGSSNRQSLEIINRSGEHLLDLINDILEMAKIEAGQVSLTPLGFDLDALLGTLGDLFDTRARSKGLVLVIDRHPALPRYLYSDEPKLRQVLINLVGNAIKFTPQGQVGLHIAPAHPLPYCPATGTDLAIAFTVSDTGIGIAAEYLGQLFAPFMQVNQGVEVFEGTGLGLSISHQFVQLLGGDLTVESQLGKGSTFTFTLPMQVANGVKGSDPVLPSAQIAELAPGQPSYRILVVDDDEAHRQLLTQLLDSVGFEVDEARDGQEAIALWERWRPQLIWLDMRMPILSGHEVAQHLRAQEQAADLAPTKIIALTANAFEDDRAQAFEGGCDDFVRKPFQLSYVLAKLAEHLGVQYIYRPEPLATPAAPMAEADAIVALGTLPNPLRTQLYNATLKLDSDLLTQLIAQIPAEHRSLAELLHQHLDDFAFDTIHTLLVQTEDSRGAS